jgi:hypothetical protein
VHSSGQRGLKKASNRYLSPASLSPAVMDNLGCLELGS